MIKTLLFLLLILTSTQVMARPSSSYSWYVGSWSRTSGDEFVRQVYCVKNGARRVKDALCPQPKPATTKSYSWSVSEWSACSATACGTSGTQTRTVTCVRNDGVVAESSSTCTAPKPAESQACAAPLCQQSYAWVIGNWVKGSGDTFSRTVVCRRSDGVVVADSYCPQPKPMTYKSYSWVTGEWGACSANACGTSGTQSRTVTCVRNDGVVAADQSVCTSEKPVSTQACSAPACNVGVAPIEIIITPSFKTAGVIVSLPADAPSSVSAKLFYRKEGEESYREGVFFTRYDLNNMATSIFDLDQNTSYELRIDYRANGVLTSKSAKFKTRLDAELKYPAALRTINVSSFSALQSALNSAQPGDHIVLAAGVHTGLLSVSNKRGTAANPIVIRGAVKFDQFSPAGARAILDGALGGTAIALYNSAYIVIDNLEIRNGGTTAGFGSGVTLSSSYQITVQNSYIHDNGKYNVKITKSDSYLAMGGTEMIGRHLIQNNFITDTSDASGCPADAYTGCDPITYFGIHMSKISAGANVIRYNSITRHIDNISACGDGAEAKLLYEDTPHVLKLTSAASGKFFDHDGEIYENVIHSGLDDDIQMDGVCVNLKVYENTLGNEEQASVHALTTSTASPGPIFILRNVIKHYRASALKLNNGGSPTSYTRNVYLFHNTFVRAKSTSYALMNLWYGGAGATSVRNIVFKNNIFYGPNGGRATDINTSNYGGPVGTTFDYNLWYTPTTASNLFEWFDGTSIKAESSIEGFRLISGQERNGHFAPPLLDPDYAPESSSPVIDNAVRIPGINDLFNGDAPDIGAKEF